MAIQRDGRGVITVTGSGASWYDNAEYYGSWWGEEPGILLELWCSILRDGIPYTAASELSGIVGSTISDGGTWTNYLQVVADDTYAYRVNARRDGVVQNSNMKSFKAYAGPVAFQSLAVSNPQQTSIDFTGQFRPTTLDSVAVAYLQYKKTTDITWLNFSNSGNKQGYGWETLAGTVTGLEAGTSYQFRLYVTRNTENDTTANSSTISLSTLASTPVVTTEPASSVSDTNATMNGTIDANSLPGGVDVTFEWNTQAHRRVSYVDATNITDGSVLTLGANVYHFKSNAVAAGQFAYSGQPSPGDFIDIEGDTYTFVEELTADDGIIAYADATNPTPGTIVTIPTLLGPDGVYTFVASGLVAVAGDVDIGASADATMLNLSRAINKSGGTEGIGFDYIAFDFGAGAAAHPDFVATHDSGGDEVTLAAGGVGPDYNVDITTDEVSFTITDPANGSWVAAAGDVLIGATEDDTFTNLERAINDSGGTSGVGEDYIAVGGGASQWVWAAINVGGNLLDVTALEAGAAGNDITLTDSSTAITTTVMAGGADIPGVDDYEVLIGADADATMLNLARCVNAAGGTPGVDYNAAAPHPYCVASRRAIDDYVDLNIETNDNPVLTFTTDEPTFTLTSDYEDPYVNETTVENFSNDGTTPFSRSFSQESVTLVSDRTYFFRAKAVYTANGGGTLYGVDLSFTTPGIPGPLAIEEEHMQTIQFDGQFGTAKTVTFTLREPSGSSSDLFYTGAAPLQADCLIFKDGVYDSTSDNVAVRVLSGAVAIYTLALSATEMEAETVDVVIHDASGSAFRDAHIQVRTAQRLSELDVDATNGPIDVSAITAIGNGAGHGIFATSAGTGADINAILSSMWLRVANAQAGAGGNEIKLDAGASSTDDYYNGCVVSLLSGTGAGQARVITAYAGGVRTATVDTAWNTNPDATTLYGLGAGSRPWALAPAEELQIGELPGPTASYGEMMQLLFQRFAFKIEQTASAQTWYNSSGDPLFDRSVSDDGVVQTIEALADV